jgi:hypothetical protein
VNQKDTIPVEITFSKALGCISFKIERNYYAIKWSSEDALQEALAVALKTMLEVTCNYKSDRHPLAETIVVHIAQQVKQPLVDLIQAFNKSINSISNESFQRGQSLLVGLNEGSLSIDDFQKFKKRGNNG